MSIYEILKKDHKAVMDLLEQLISLKADSGQREGLIEKIRGELIPHARAEESVLYNSLRSMEEAKGRIGHVYQEHFEAETKLRTLQLKDKIDADWRKTARELKKTLQHHIHEEEGPVFSLAKELLTAQEAQSMGRAFLRLKNQVKKESAMKSTLRLVANLMPPRFVKAFRKAA